jgi:hypothetical protein
MLGKVVSAALSSSPHAAFLMILYPGNLDLKTLFHVCEETCQSTADHSLVGLRRTRNACVCRLLKKLREHADAEVVKRACRC